MVSAYSLRTTQPRINTGTSRSVARTLYRSPQFGYSVTGAHPWVVAGIETSSSDSETDRVLLQMRGPGRADVEIVCTERWNVLDSAETVHFWTSEEYLAEYMEPGTLVVLSD